MKLLITVQTTRQLLLRSNLVAAPRVAYVSIRQHLLITVQTTRQLLLRSKLVAALGVGYVGVAYVSIREHT
jgi:hypothetical protein